MKMALLRRNNDSFEPLTEIETEAVDKSQRKGDENLPNFPKQLARKKEGWYDKIKKSKIYAK